MCIRDRVRMEEDLPELSESEETVEVSVDSTVEIPALSDDGVEENPKS